MTHTTLAPHTVYVNPNLRKTPQSGSGIPVARRPSVRRHRLLHSPVGIPSGHALQSSWIAGPRPLKAESDRATRRARQARRADGRRALRPGRDRAPGQRGRARADPLHTHPAELGRVSDRTGRHSLPSPGDTRSRSHPRLGQHPRTGQRFEELRGEQVAYAIHRQERTFLPDRDHCPLCPTRPGGPATEIPVAAFEIAVFDNRFPAFEAPHGAAEVVVYTDKHEGSLGTLAPERAEALMWVWRHRYMELAAREDVDYVFIFENRGVEVGVTLHHPHGQIYGYPLLPPVARLELAAAARLGGCAPCALLERELSDGRRVVYENERVLAYVPHAARWPYEAHVAMREHRPSLLDCD